MSQKLNIGQKFEDFFSFEIAIQQYQNAENVQFFWRSSRTIAKAQRQMPEKKLNERLKYYEIQFHCIRGSKNFKSRSTGMRDRVVCLNFSLSSEMTKIQLNVISSCADDVELGWMIFTPDDELLSLSNCSLTVSEHLEKPAVDHWFPILHRQGTYKLGDKLFDGLRYSFQMKCGRIGSNSVLLTALDNCTQAKNKSHDPDVVYEKQTGLFGSTQDTVLGVMFGLFGFAIILVTSYYLWRRYRNRQRRQRIRSYLGASLIDPFANMQNRMDEMEASGGQRLIGSSDSL